MDHPIAVLRLEEDVTARHRRTVEDELHLAVGPLLDVVVALVPDEHPAASVLPPRYLTLEGGVLERMVFGVHREMIVVRSLREALGERPGNEDAVMLEAKVPMQAARMVLLDDEPRRALARRRTPAHRLRGLPGVPLGPVGVEGVGALRGPGPWRFWCHHPPRYRVLGLAGPGRVDPCTRGGGAECPRRGAPNPWFTEGVDPHTGTDGSGSRHPRLPMLLSDVAPVALPRRRPR